MSEHLAPDPKPSCCLSSPMGTCEQHATYSVEELRIMELEDRIRTASGRLIDMVCHWPGTTREDAAKVWDVLNPRSER